MKRHIVGITGSVGKTTTKEMLCSILKKIYNTQKSDGNINELNQPDEAAEAIVVEIGLNNSIGISELSKIAEPTIAVITNIGVSHIEKLGSREKIYKAKLEILDGLKENTPVILNGDDPYLAGTEIKNHEVIYYGVDNPTCDFRAVNIVQNEESTSFDIVFGENRQSITIPTIGIHNVYNAVAAFCTGIQLGVIPDQAAKALEEDLPSFIRQAIKTSGGIKFIESCDNLSPDSQRAALKMLSSVTAERRVAVLCDMQELGSISVETHIISGIIVKKSRVDVLYTLGEKSILTAQKASELGVHKVMSFLDKKELVDALFEELKDGDVVLFNADKKTALDDVINDLYSRIK